MRTILTVLVVLGTAFLSSCERRKTLEEIQKEFEASRLGRISMLDREFEIVRVSRPDTVLTWMESPVEIPGINHSIINDLRDLYELRTRMYSEPSYNWNKAQALKGIMIEDLQFLFSFAERTGDLTSIYVMLESAESHGIFVQDIGIGLDKIRKVSARLLEEAREEQVPRIHRGERSAAVVLASMETTFNLITARLDRIEEAMRPPEFLRLP